MREGGAPVQGAALVVGQLEQQALAELVVGEAHAHLVRLEDARLERGGEPARARELRKGAPHQRHVHVAPEDRAEAQHGPRRLGEAREPPLHHLPDAAGEQPRRVLPLDHALEGARVLGQRAQELDEEERIPLALALERGDQRRARAPLAEQPARRPLERLGRQPLEDERGHRAERRRQVGPLLRAVGGEDQDARVDDGVRDRAQHREALAARPVQILQHDDRRPGLLAQQLRDHVAEAREPRLRVDLRGRGHLRGR